MNEHYDRISAIADDLLHGLRRERDRKPIPGVRHVPDEHRRRKALRLVEECAEYFCPPPQSLVEALRLAFMDNKRVPVTEKNRKRQFRGKSIEEEFTVRLLAAQVDIEPASWKAFCLAAEEEAKSCEFTDDGGIRFLATEYRVAKVAAVARKSIRVWRENPHYIRRASDAARSMGK